MASCPLPSSYIGFIVEILYIYYIWELVCPRALYDPSWLSSALTHSIVSWHNPNMPTHTYTPDPSTSFIGWSRRETDWETDREKVGLVRFFFGFNPNGTENRPAVSVKNRKPTEGFCMFGSQLTTSWCLSTWYVHPIARQVGFVYLRKNGRLPRVPTYIGPDTTVRRHVPGMSSTGITQGETCAVEGVGYIDPSVSH